MKIPSTNPFLGLCLGAAAISASLHAATVLQFGGTSNIGLNGGSPPMDEAYGDNVTASNTTTGIVASVGVDAITGTPDIGLAYNPNTSGVFDSYPNWNGRGHVLQTDFGTGGGPLDIVFSPTISMGVMITSFDLDEYTGGGNAVIGWAVKNGATTIVSGSADFTTINGGRITVNTGMTYAQAVANLGSPISLELTKTGGTGSYYAMDNLAFDQVVPEPSTAALGSLALGALALRRRRG